MKYTIIDLDNCISDDSKRIKYLDPIKYAKYSEDDRIAAYNLQCCFDKFVWGISCPLPENIIIFTGRPILYGPLTRYWLEKNKIVSRNIFMRPIENKMGSPELKEMFLSLVFKDKYIEIEMAYDDRQDVLNMYNKCGIQTTLKRINDYENG